MAPTSIEIVAIIAVVGLILIRVHVGIAMGIIGLAGAYVVMGDTALVYAKIIPFSASASYELIVLPMFILMGMVAASSGIAESLFTAGQNWMGWMRGGLLMATTLSMGLFGACSGSSLATATTFTKLALPELIRKKFDPGLAAGAIAAAGTQAALIPPSALLVFYGILTEQSIGELMIAAVVPGAISVFIYCFAVWVTLSLFPHLGPGTERHSLKTRVSSLQGVWPMPLILVGVVGGLYFGIFTPTEAGAAGAFLSLVSAVVHVGFKKARIPEAFVDTILSASMIFFVLVAVQIFSSFSSASGFPDHLNSFLESLNLSETGIVLLLLAFYLLAGCVFDAIAIIAITMPFIFPLLETMAINPIWFGILLVKVVEIGLITPPIGMIVFIVQGMAGKNPEGHDVVKTSQLFKGIVPFLIADLVTLVLLLLLPQLSLWLPGTMN